MQSQKRQNDLCSIPRQTIQYHSNPSLCLINNAEEAEVEWFYEDLQGLQELTHKKDVLSIIGDWECKSRKSRDTWSNRQIWPWSTKWNRSKANRVFPREYTGHSNNTKEDSTHGNQQIVHKEIRLIICFAAKDGEALYSQEKQDWELTVIQIMNSLLPNSDLNWRK